MLPESALQAAHNEQLEGRRIAFHPRRSSSLANRAQKISGCLTYRQGHPLVFPDLLEAELLLDQDHCDPTWFVFCIDGQQFIDGAVLPVDLPGTLIF